MADAKCDGNAAYGNWNGSTNNRLENRSGCGTTVFKSLSSAGAYRACTDIQFAPDSCSGWVR